MFFKLLASSLLANSSLPEPTGPFGAKGIGEAAMNPVAAAYANAIANAIGVRVPTTPLTPNKVLAALERRNA